MSYGSVPTSVTCARLVSVHQLAASPIIARLGWGNGPLQPVIEVSTESATPKSQVAGKRAANCGWCGGGGSGPPLVEVLWCLTNILQRLQAAAVVRWFWPVPRAHWQPSVVVSGLSGARSLRKGHNKVLICHSQLSLDWIMEFDFSLQQLITPYSVLSKVSDHFRPRHQQTCDFLAAQRTLCRRCRRQCAAPSSLGDKGDKCSCTLRQI